MKTYFIIIVDYQVPKAWEWSCCVNKKCMKIKLKFPGYKVNAHK